MPRARGFVVVLVVVTILGTAGTAAAYHTRFVADNCNYAAPTPTSYITRDGSAAVALRARYEGYQWAGGCWNDNDRDDSPNDPHEDPRPAVKVATAPASRSRSGASRSTRAMRDSSSGDSCATYMGHTPPQHSRLVRERPT